MIGDFNTILMAKEKLSIHPPSSLSVKDFNDMILSYGLKDLGFNSNRLPGQTIGRVRSMLLLGWTKLSPILLG